jgi:hypothetical protein
LRSLGGLRKVYDVVPVVRWLLTLVVALAVASSSAVSFASAGVVGDSQCCCPIKAKCKCHDHDKDPRSAPTLKRCNGEGKLVLPVIATAIEVAPPEINDAPRTLCPEALLPVQPPEDRTIEIVTPPS